MDSVPLRNGQLEGGGAADLAGWCQTTRARARQPSPAIATNEGHAGKHHREYRGAGTSSSAAMDEEGATRTLMASSARALPRLPRAASVKAGLSEGLAKSPSGLWEPSGRKRCSEKPFRPPKDENGYRNPKPQILNCYTNLGPYRVVGLSRLRLCEVVSRGRAHGDSAYKLVKTCSWKSFHSGKHMGILK